MHPFPPAEVRQAPTLEQQRDQLISEHRTAESDALSRARRIGELRVRYELEGGGNFTSWFGTGLSHATLQDYLRSAEAQRAGITSKSHSDLVAAGRLLRTKQEEGLPTPQAVASVQEAVDKGVVRVRAARPKDAPDGLTRIDLPDVSLEVLNRQRDRVAALAERVGMQDVPSAAPERLAFLAEVVEAIGDDVLLHLLTAIREAGER